MMWGGSTTVDRERTLGGKESNGWEVSLESIACSIYLLSRGVGCWISTRTMGHIQKNKK